MSKKSFLRSAMLGLFLVAVAGLAGAQSRDDKEGSTVTVQEGTTLRITLNTSLSTRDTRQGDRFTASLREPIYVNGVEVIPFGTKIEGRVTQVQRPGHTHGVGKLDLAFDRIELPNGYDTALVASTAGAETSEKTKVGKEGTINGPSSRKQEAEEVAVAGGIGAGIGAIAGGGKGTAIGGGAGALVGLADRMRRRGKDLDLPAGSTLVLRLDRPLQVPVSNNR